jgi:hypothetical protein
MVGMTPDEIADYVVRGQEHLMECAKAGLVEVDGSRMVLDSNAFPMGSAVANIKRFLRQPRMLYGEPGGATMMVPRHPLSNLQGMQKSQVTTGDTGAFNAIFGAIAVLQIAQQQNFVGSVGEMGYEKNGYRGVSAAGIASHAGAAEGGSIGTSVEPTYQEINVGLKDLLVPTEMSTRMEIASTKNDTITFAGNAQVIFSNWMNAMDVDYLEDFDTLPTASGHYDAESLDRITASYAGATAVGYTAGDEDLYGVDRSSNAWFDSNMIQNSASLRQLTTPLVDALLKGQRKFWGQDMGNKVYYTGTDCWDVWSALEGSKQRFSHETVINAIGQGVQPVIGQAGGYKLATYGPSQHPVVLDDNIVVDTGGVSRIYLVDKNHLGICMGLPPQAIEGSNIAYLGYIKHLLVYYTVQEIWCDLPAAQGQLRDLSA